MGRYIRKCKASTATVRQMTVMEVTQVVGVRTRSRAIKAAAAASVPNSTAFKDQAEVQLEAYLQLRSRRLFIAPRIARTPLNSGATRCSMSKLEGCTVVPSRCSSSSSTVNGVKAEEDAAERSYLRSGDAEVACDQESLVGNFVCNTQRRELTPSSEYKLGEVSDLESETGEKSRCRSRVDSKMPSQSEIDEFFAVAEKAVRDRFASKYNFDVEKEVALEGRYDWVKLNY